MTRPARLVGLERDLRIADHAPIVDPRTACAEARRRTIEAKRSPAVRARVADVFERHGSRATALRRRSR